MKQSPLMAATPARSKAEKTANIALWTVQILATAPVVLRVLAGVVAWGRRGSLNPALSRLEMVTP